MLREPDRLRFHRRRITVFLVLLVVAPIVSQAKNREATREKPRAPITQGQRVFTCGHSFHFWVPPILSNMAQGAGIQGHVAVGLSAIGGSRVIQHWDVPDAKNLAKKSLRPATWTC